MTRIFVLLCIIVLPILTACSSQNLINVYKKNGYKMEKIDIDQIKKWSEGKDQNKLNKRQKLLINNDGGFNLIEKITDEKSVNIHVEKKHNNLSITKYVLESNKERGESTEEVINFNKNGTIEQKAINSIKILENSKIGKIRIVQKLSEQYYDEQENLIFDYGYNKSFLFSLEGLLKVLEDIIKEDVFSGISVSTIYMKSNTEFPTYLEPEMNEILIREQPYWRVLYIYDKDIPDRGQRSISKRLYIDGISGEIIKEIERITEIMY